MNYTEIFNALHPGFFNEKYISSLPPECEYTELVTDLREPPSGVQPVTFPPDITFGVYHGEITDLREAVREVDEGWLPYFTPNERFFCAYDGEKPVAFCILTDSGNIMGLHIGQPGCVGTIPAYRKKGIGAELILRATGLLRRENFDLSWIHYTHLESWYQKLGYRTVLRWNCTGILSGRQ